MSCNSNCLINCDEIISDQCVQYTGVDVPALGICSGDQLSSVEQVILTELQNALDGTGITPDQVTLENCQWLSDQFIGQESNLNSLLQLLINSSCSLKGMIDLINANSQENSINFNTLCLQGLPASPTVNDVIQGVINTLCTLNTTVQSIPATYVKNSDLNSLVQQQIQIYLSNAQTGQINYYQYLPLKTALPYFGDLANFDNTGKGLASAGMTNMYLCNGLNGTPDIRGRGVVGAIRNVPGGVLDPAVDPSNVINSPGNVNFGVNDKSGEFFHGLTISETPAHTHGVVDPKHTHTQTINNAYAGQNGSTQAVAIGNNSTTPRILPPTMNPINMSATGISITSTGGGQSHNNIQPIIASYWIIRMA